MTDKLGEGVGYVYPALFHLENNRWALITETDVTNNNVGSHLSDFTNDISQEDILGVGSYGK